MSLDEIKARGPTVDRKRLRETTEEEIRRHMVEDGQDPDAPLPPYAPPPQARVVRMKLGLSQQEFADLLRIPVGTLRNWEQGRAPPDPAARALLAILARRPKEAVEALREEAAAAG